MALTIPVIELDAVDSTNAEALRRARKGERGPVWIVAQSQTAGRGRQGRGWTSERGNLYSTLLLSNPAPRERVAELSLVAGLAVSDALLRLAPGLANAISLKWPNDVLLDGGKVAGILIEGESGICDLVVAAGIGINCSHHPEQTRLPATDLAAQGVDAESGRVFDALSMSVAERLAQWSRGQGFASIRADWLDRAAGLGQDIVARLGDREFRGRFETLDDAGRLILLLPDGQKQIIGAGEIFPLPPQNSPPAIGFGA